MAVKDRGFASMDPVKRSMIASMGGKVSGGNFRINRAQAQKAGRIGGKRSRRVPGDGIRKKIIIVD